MRGGDKNINEVARAALAGSEIHEFVELPAASLRKLDISPLWELAKAHVLGFYFRNLLTVLREHAARRFEKDEVELS